MRRRTTIVFLTLAFLATGQTGFAQERTNDDEQSGTLKGKVAQETVSTVSAGSGGNRPRKLAMVAPRNKSTESKEHSKPEGLAFGGGWRPQIPETITIKVPRDLSNAADVCVVAARRMAINAQKNAGEMYKWWGKFFRQMHSAPMVTPGGAYLSSQPVPATPAKMYYTHEGRLKTVVSR